jgi:hypothetical protein
MSFSRRSLLAAFAAAPLFGGEQGWKSIQPNKHLKGWTRYPIPANAIMDTASQWSSNGKTLVCAGDKGHEFLLMDKPLKDFIFHVEFQFTKIAGSPKYNSGIFVRTKHDNSIWYQVQCGSSSGGYIFGIAPDEKGVPKRINLQKEMKEERMKPAGEWNVIEITCKGKTITSQVNGAVVSEVTDSLVAEGQIGLEAEGYRIEFKNLKLKQLQ